MRVAAIIFALTLTSCDNKKAPESEPDQAAAKSCQTMDDCGSGEMCLASKCVKTGSKALVTDPQNAVTPAKVKQELEQINEQQEKKIDDTLDL